MYTSTCWKSIYTPYDIMLPLTEITYVELENLFYDTVTNHFLCAWSSRETLDLMQHKVPLDCLTQLSYDLSLQTSFFKELFVPYKFSCSHHHGLIFFYTRYDNHIFFLALQYIELLIHWVLKYFDSICIAFLYLCLMVLGALFCNVCLFLICDFTRLKELEEKNYCLAKKSLKIRG